MINNLKSTIDISQDELAALCRKYHVCKLSLFGSVLRDDFRPDSDIDILVEFEPETQVGLDFITFQNELGVLFGRPVDLNTPDFLSRYFRTKVMNSAQVIYEQT
jgi:predicted nucleotidyltransferase